MHLLAYGAVTDRGPVRTINEDSILAAPPVFVVADGVGGNEAGEVASAIVVEEFARLAEHPVIEADGVSATIQAAHARVRDFNEGRPNGASSTAVGAVGVMSGDEPYWVVFNIGDSRVYRLGVGTPDAPDRELTQISVDHSHVQELVDAAVITPEQAEHHPDRNLVTRAIGAEEVCEPDFWMMPMVPGDRLLICSDGLLALSGTQLAEQLVADRDPSEIATGLLQSALAAETTDNVSVIVVDVAEGGDGVPQSEELTAAHANAQADRPQLRQDPGSVEAIL